LQNPSLVSKHGDDETFNFNLDGNHSQTKATLAGINTNQSSLIKLEKPFSSDLYDYSIHQEEKLQLPNIVMNDSKDESKAQELIH
jgi:hypothetical protein